MDANLRLSPEESRLVMDPGWILTKNSIIRKVVGLFAGLSEEYRALLEGAAGPGSAANGAAGVAGLAAAQFGSPKISKGENYRGLPYVMLDYPRLFGREDVLAIRTFFWWGSAFSVMLHLKGEHRERYWPVIQRRWAELEAAGFHVGVSEDEWRHEWTPENFQPMMGREVAAGAGASAAGPSFLKLSAACELGRWDDAQTVLADFFRLLVNVLTDTEAGALKR